MIFEGEVVGNPNGIHSVETEEVLFEDFINGKAYGEVYIDNEICNHVSGRLFAKGRLFETDENSEIIEYPHPKINVITRVITNEMYWLPIFVSILKTEAQAKLNAFNRQSASNDCVYLMKDTNTGFTKIGYSKNPHYREGTLQSQKPTIEMIINFPCDRKIEKELHKKYAAKRIRGEWFNLTKLDIEDIKAQLLTTI